MLPLRRSLPSQIRCLLGLSLGVLAVVGLPTTSVWATPNPELSVALRDGASRVSFTSSQGMVLRNAVTDQILKVFPGERAMSLEATVDGIQVQGLGSFSKLTLEPRKGSLLRVDGNGYRGRLRLEENRFGKISVVNLVDLESYLKGVIPAEMLVKSPLEALKAQAVVARTFALRHRERFHKDRGYGLTADTTSQVYRGVVKEDPRSSKAVEETRGSVLHIENKLVDAYYHQACGGYTQNNEDVWGGRVREHLRSVSCPYCRQQYKAQGYGNFDWTFSISYDQLRLKLLEHGLDLDEIQSIRYQHHPRGGIQSFELKHRGQSLSLSAAKLRNILGTSLLRSSLVRVSEPISPASSPSGPPKSGEAALQSILSQYLETRRAQSLELEGSGSGHGVGLCQWGARRLASLGKSHEGILKTYFRNVSVGPLLPTFSGD